MYKIYPAITLKSYAYKNIIRKLRFKQSQETTHTNAFRCLIPLLNLRKRKPNNDYNLSLKQ